MADPVTEEQEVVELLASETIRVNLECRVRMAQIIGLIKFLNDLPVYVPEVEQKILEHVKSQSLMKKMNPVMTSSFFKVVIEHSKAVQIRLAELMKGREQEASQILAEAMSSLKNSESQKTGAHHALSDKKTLPNEQLSYCRPFVQKATDNILSEMENVSVKNSLARKLAAINCGLFSTSAQVSLPSLPQSRNERRTPASVGCRRSRL